MADQVEVEIIPKVTSAALNVLKDVFGKVIGTISGVHGPGMSRPATAVSTLAGSAVSGRAVVSTGMSAIGAASGAATALATPAGAIMSALGPVMAMVSKANPAVVERLEQAFSDVLGTIGQALIPVVEAVTPVVRMLGDTLASVLDPALVGEIVSAFQPLIESFGDILKTLAPALKDIVKIAADLLVPVIKLIAETLKWIIDKVMVVLRPLLKLVGLSVGEEGGKFAKSSVGMSAHGGGSASIEELGKRSQMAAFMMAPQVQMARTLESIDQKVGGINHKMNPDEPGYMGNL